MVFRIVYLFSVFVFFNVSAQNPQRIETMLQQGHSAYVTAYDFSPDGTLLVSGSWDNSILLWSVQSGKQIRMFNRHTGPVRSLMFSSDGKNILSSSSDNTARIFETETGKQILEVKMTKNELQQAYFSPDNDQIILLDNRDGMYVHNAENGKLMVRAEKNHSAYYLSSVMHPKNGSIITTSDYRSAQAISVKTGDTLLRLPFEKSYAMAYSKNGKYIALGSSKLFAGVFDAVSGRQLYELVPDPEQQCDGCNTVVEFSNNSRWIITKTAKSEAVLWDLSNGKKVKTFCAKEERPTHIRFSPDDQFALFAFDEEIEVYDVKSGQLRMKKAGRKLSGVEFRFAPDSKSIAVPSEENGIEIWDATTGQKRKTLEGFLNRRRDDGLRFDYSYWRDKAILKYITFKRSIALSPDNRFIAFGNIDSTAMIMDVESGKIIHYLKGHHSVVYALDYSPDGKFLATAGGDRVIRIWNAKTGILFKELKGHRELIFDVKFNSDGSRILSGSWDATLRNWDLVTGESEHIDLGNVSPYTVGFTPNDLYFLTGDLGKGLHFWEADAGQQFRSLVGHTEVLSSFDFSADGKYLFTASWDGKVKMWDILTGMLIAKMEKHAGQVYALACDPKNRFIASGGADQDIIIWEASTNKILARLKGHNTSVCSMRFSSKGDKLFSGSVDGTIKVWDMSTMKEQYSRVQINRTEWLATAPGGQFDGSSGALQMVNYVSGTQVVPVGALFGKYYTPGLISRITAGESFGVHASDINRQIALSPLIELLADGNEKRSASNRFDSVFQWRKNSFPLSVRIDARGQVLEEILIYNNGKLVMREPFSETIVFRGGEKDIRHFNVPLYDGINELTAVVINSARTESAPAVLQVRYDGKAAKTDLFIFTIGINNYKNPQYELKYAVNDAQAFSSAIRQGADSLFSTIQEYSLNNEQADRNGILSVMEEIKSKAGPEDVFLFYYAGHGVMSMEKNPTEQDFFIVTHDLTNLYDQSDVLRRKAISATELMKFSKEVSALKQLFILDACHSGGALNALATRGDGREKALAQLARSTGTFFLTASQDAQFANEAGNLKHGLFTYSLLEILGGKVADADKRITVNEIKTYVEERVPELAEELRGTPQYPTSYSFGQDFPIIILR